MVIANVQLHIVIDEGVKPLFVINNYGNCVVGGQHGATSAREHLRPVRGFLSQRAPQLEIIMSCVEHKEMPLRKIANHSLKIESTDIITFHHLAVSDLFLHETGPPTYMAYYAYAHNSKNQKHTSGPIQ